MSNSNISKAISEILENRLNCKANVLLNELEVSIKNGKAKVRIDVEGTMGEKEMSEFLLGILANDDSGKQ